jgi:hypothetical protein
MTAVLEKPRDIARRFSAAVDSSTTGVQPADRVSLPADLLDGGEIVLLALRPSLWFLVFDSDHLRRGAAGAFGSRFDSSGRAFAKAGG